jgi:hypothetical protein
MVVGQTQDTIKCDVTIAIIETHWSYLSRFTVVVDAMRDTMALISFAAFTLSINRLRNNSNIDV